MCSNTEGARTVKHLYMKRVSYDCTMVGVPPSPAFFFFVFPSKVRYYYQKEATLQNERGASPSKSMRSSKRTKKPNNLGNYNKYISREMTEKLSKNPIRNIPGPT